MTVSYNNITVRLLPDDKAMFDTNIASKSIYFTSAYSFNLATVVAPASADVIKDASLGVLWYDILPDEGAYTVDMATVLPYYLPTFDGLTENVFTVDESELVVSSRMMRCFYTDSTSADELRYFLCHIRGIESLKQQKSFASLQPIPLRTFVAKRFRCKSDSAEAMIQRYFPSWADNFVREIAKLIESIRVASPKDAKHLLPQFSTPSLPVFWVSVVGAEGKKGAQQFCGDMPSAAFRPLSNLDADAVESVHQSLRGGTTVPVHEAAIALAHTFCHYGYLDLAVVQICIACEAALGAAYRRFLISRGVSTTKYNDQKREITFSQLLHLHLASMCDLSLFGDSETVVATLNKARKIRNDVVHGGAERGNVSQSDVEGMIAAADSLATFISRECNWPDVS